MKQLKVFLGGTCNESKWRERMIPHLKIGFFNPVVADWTQEAMENELKEREECDLVLYLITPMMTGVYSIAEAVDDSNKRPEKTIFCFLTDDFPSGNENGDSVTFTGPQLKSLKAVAEMVVRNGGRSYNNALDVINVLNLIQQKEDQRKE